MLWTIAWPHPHICTEVASDDIKRLIFPMRICQNLGKSDSIVCVWFYAHIIPNETSNHHKSFTAKFRVIRGMH